MAYTESKLRKIFKKGNGRCHLCRKLLQFDKYGRTESIVGAWRVYQVKTNSKAGLSSVSNLLPSCPQCYRENGNKYPY